MDIRDGSFDIILSEVGEIKKELRRIANYLEVIAKLSQAELLFKYGKEIEIKEENK